MSSRRCGYYSVISIT